MLLDEVNTVSIASECSPPTLKPVQKTEAKHISPFLSCIVKYFSNLQHLLKLQTQPSVRESVESPLASEDGRFLQQSSSTAILPPSLFSTT